SLVAPILNDHSNERPGGVTSSFRLPSKLPSANAGDAAINARPVAAAQITRPALSISSIMIMPPSSRRLRIRRKSSPREKKLVLLREVERSEESCAMTIARLSSTRMGTVSLQQRRLFLDQHAHFSA